MIRRCGKRYPTEEAALHSKRGLTGAYTAVLCRCEGWHLVDAEVRGGSARKQREGCGKKRYRDEIAAKLALANAQRKDGSRRPKMERRAYRCPVCRGWHLTSQTPRKPPRNTGPSPKVRATVLERDQYQCVACGKPVGMPGSWWSIQHRVARGVGGGNVPQNLLTLCGSATSAGCHRRAEDRDPEFHARGYWLRSDEDPALVPVMLFSEGGSGITAWPTADGQWVVEAPAQRSAS